MIDARYAATLSANSCYSSTHLVWCGDVSREDEHLRAVRFAGEHGSNAPADAFRIGCRQVVPLAAIGQSRTADQCDLPNPLRGKSLGNRQTETAKTASDQAGALG